MCEGNSGIFKKFWGHFEILRKIGGQNVNFGGKLEILRIYFGPMWNLRKFGSEIGIYEKERQIKIGHVASSKGLFPPSVSSPSLLPNAISLPLRSTWPKVVHLAGGPTTCTRRGTEFRRTRNIDLGVDICPIASVRAKSHTCGPWTPKAPVIDLAET